MKGLLMKSLWSALSVAVVGFSLFGCSTPSRDDIHKLYLQKLPARITTFEELTKLLDESDKLKGKRIDDVGLYYWNDELNRNIQGIVEDNDSPPEFLTEIVRRNFDHYSGERFCTFAAKNRNASVVLLNHLADHHRKSVRSTVAKNPNATPEILRKIYFGPGADFYSRGIAAEQRNAPPYIVVAFLQEALSTTDLMERRWAGSFSRGSFEYYTKLSKDPDEVVRRRVAENEHTPKPVLLSLTQDADSTIRKRAIETIEKVKKDHFTKKARDSACSNKAVLSLIGSVPEFDRYDIHSDSEPCPSGGFQGHIYFRVEKPANQRGCLIGIRWQSKDCENDFQPLEVRANSSVIWRSQ